MIQVSGVKLAADFPRKRYVICCRIAHTSERLSIKNTSAVQMVLAPMKRQLSGLRDSTRPLLTKIYMNNVRKSERNEGHIVKRPPSTIHIFSEISFTAIGAVAIHQRRKQFLSMARCGHNPERKGGIVIIVVEPANSVTRANKEAYMLKR
jgi:hypothetical protein